MEIITQNAHETESIGREMGSSLRGSEVLFLKGELGAGKTTFVQGLSHGLGVETPVTSPTFILMRSYRLPKKNERTAKMLYHVDLYRLEQEIESEVKNLGIFDLWGKPDTIFVIEWADRLAVTPPNLIQVDMEVLDIEKRKITTTFTPNI